MLITRRELTKGLNMMKYFIASTITVLSAISPTASAEDQCITKAKAAELAADYIPFGMANDTSEVMPSGHYYWITATAEKATTGIHVSCTGEVTKMNCDAAKNCTTEKASKCIKQEEAINIIDHAIRGGQVDGERRNDIQRSGFRYVFFLSYRNYDKERRHAFVTCDGEVQSVSCNGECNYIPLKPWKTPDTVRDFKTVEGSWYYCQRFIEEHAPHGLKSNIEMIVKMPAIRPEIYLKGGTFGDSRAWSCKICRHVKENPDPGGLPLECDVQGMPVKEKRN